MNTLFQYVFFDKDTVRKHFDRHTLVYPSTKIIQAFNYTSTLEQSRLLQLHSSELPGSQARIARAKGELGRLREEMMLSDELFKEFKPLQYLDSVAVTIESIPKNNGDSCKNVFPRMFRRRLRSFFREFHVFTFYKENYRSIPDGAELLLKSAYYLKKQVPVHFNIDCDIAPDSHGFEFEAADDYFRFLEWLNNPKRANKRQLSHEEVASILTSYFSTSEVRAMGIEIKFLHLDIVWYGPTVESLIGEAFVIGKNPEEFITIFENSHGSCVTVVTGPHYGHARNREIFMVDIEDEGSLRTVVNEWFKSGTD